MYINIFIHFQSICLNRNSLFAFKYNTCTKILLYSYYSDEGLIARQIRAKIVCFMVKSTKIVTVVVFFTYETVF